jgi:hypothetical protein
MRSEKSNNWVKYLPIAVGLLNKRPLKRIGNLAPGSINTMFDDVKVREAVKKSGIPIKEEPTYQEQNELQAKYEKSKGNNNNPLTLIKLYLSLKLALFNVMFFNFRISSQ